MKALVGAFNQEKALVGAFSVIVQPVVEPMDQFAALLVHLGPRFPEVRPPVVQVYEEDRGGGEHDEARHAEVDQQHVAGDAEGEVPAQCQCVSSVPLSAPH